MQPYISNTKNWVEKVVIGLNLCPFAKPVFAKNQIKFAVSEATNTQALTQDLIHELLFLSGIEGDDTETTILIHPLVLQDFEAYMDFVEAANDMIYELNLEGIFQIASFHPDYQFAETQKEDMENYTNRSPYPMLHIIREDTVEKAVKTYPNVAAIPQNNIQKVKTLDKAFFEKFLSLS
jgi:hypothetical protein